MTGLGCVTYKHMYVALMRLPPRYGYYGNTTNWPKEQFGQQLMFVIGTKAVSSEAGAFMLAFNDDYKYASHAKRVT